MTMIPLTKGITLLSGKMFDYLNPGATQLDVEDILTLSNICRFAGHLPIFYSVAQHLVNTSYIVEPGFEYEALMHDRSEAFTNDIPTPLKVALPAFKALEQTIEAATAPMFGVPVDMSPQVHLADRQMLGLEMRYVKGDFGQHQVLEGIDFEGLQHMPGVDLNSWTPRQARANFLRRYEELRPWKLLIPNRRDRFRAEQDIDCVYGTSIQKGSVFRVDKTRVNQAATDDELVHVTILMGPTPELTMKKYGGTASYGHGRHIANCVLRAAEVEIVEDME